MVYFSLQPVFSSTLPTNAASQALSTRDLRQLELSPRRVLLVFSPLLAFFFLPPQASTDSQQLFFSVPTQQLSPSIWLLMQLLQPSAWLL